MYRLSRLWGGEPGLKSFLEQIRGALPYLDTAVRAAAPGPGGVVLAPLRDAHRYSPRAAFLVGMAAGLYPPQRIPSSLLEEGGWTELQTLFPHLTLPAALDPHRFREEYRATLQQALVTGDRVWVSWARAYPGLEETGPSDLLLEELGEEGLEESSTDFPLAWPEPEPGAATAGRLGRFYLGQVGRLAPAHLPRAREELAGLGIAPGQLPLPAGGGKEPVAGLDYYTPSAIKNYLACPRRYYYQNILGLDVPTSPRTLLGLVLHRVLEGFHRRYPSLAGVPVEEAWAFLQELLTRAFTEAEAVLGRPWQPFSARRPRPSAGLTLTGSWPAGRKGAWPGWRRPWTFVSAATGSGAAWTGWTSCPMEAGRSLTTRRVRIGPRDSGNGNSCPGRGRGPRICSSASTAWGPGSGRPCPPDLHQPGALDRRPGGAELALRG